MREYIHRDRYLQKLIDRRENGQIKVITGLRRCGKSFLLFELYYDYLVRSGVKPEQIITISLDDDSYQDYQDTAKLSAYIRSRITDHDRMYYIFIDEVQYAISKNEIIHAEYDLRLYSVLNGLQHLGNTDIYVTGSNSKLLTKDVLTAFRGRGDRVEIFPLSFREFYEHTGGEKTEKFEDYALYGGLPLVLSKRTPDAKYQYLRDLFNEVYFKDISERYNIDLPEVLEELTDDLCSSIGSLTNASKISKTLQSVKGTKVSSNTIAQYLQYLQESFLFSQAKRFDIKGKRYFEYPSKYYCTDVGLRNARLNFRQQEETHIMENIIFNDLISRGFSVDVGVVEMSEMNADGKKSRKQVEIDFVVNRGPKRYYIQSALYLNDELKRQQEMRPLKQTGDFFKKIIVTKTTVHPWTDENGILYIGLYDFLLKDNALDL